MSLVQARRNALEGRVVRWLARRLALGDPPPTSSATYLWEMMALYLYVFRLLLR